MIYFYTILKYDFYSNKWVVMYSTKEKKLAWLKWNQYRHLYRYYKMEFVEELMVDDKKH